MIISNIFLCITLLPILGLCSICTLQNKIENHSNIASITIWTTAFTILLSLLGLIKIEPHVYSVFSINHNSMLMIFSTSILILVCSIIGAKQLKQNVKIFYIYLELMHTLFAVTSSTSNLIVFCTTYTSMFVISTGILHMFSPQGAVKLLAPTLLGSFCITISCAYIYGVTGTSDIFTFAHAGLTSTQKLYIGTTMLLGFLANSAIFPLHSWKIDVIRSTPATLSIVMYSILTPISIIGMMNILLPIFNPSDIILSQIAIILCAISSLYTVLKFKTQDNITNKIFDFSIIYTALLILITLLNGKHHIERSGVSTVIYSLTIAALIICADIKCNTYKYGSPINQSTLYIVMILGMLVPIIYPSMPNFIEYILAIQAISAQNCFYSVFYLLISLWLFYYLYVLHQYIYQPAKNTELLALASHIYALLILYSAVIIILIVQHVSLASNIAQGAS